MRRKARSRLPAKPTKKPSCFSRTVLAPEGPPAVVGPQVVTPGQELTPHGFCLKYQMAAHTGAARWLKVDSQYLFSLRGKKTPLFVLFSRGDGVKSYLSPYFFMEMEGDIPTEGERGGWAKLSMADTSIPCPCCKSFRW